MKLTRNNIVKCGFFPDNLPARVFGSQDVAKYIDGDSTLIDKIKSNLSNKKIEHTACNLISIYKNDLERRIIAIPHIETYIMLAIEIEKNRIEIESSFKKNLSSYSNTINPHSIEGYHIKSKFISNYYDRIKYSTGFKFLLKVDLSKCYENIYTHSIAWAMYGKEESKDQLKKKPKDRDPEYLKYDELDKKVRSINNNETKGIPTGPISSRIISEIILTSIDKILVDRGYHFKRYVDDYNFYFRNELEAYEFLPQFQNILYDYKLHLNTEKTKIEKYPYQLSQNLSKELGNHDFKKEGFLRYIEKFIELHNLGNKGALKFGLKVMNKRIIPEKEKEFVFSHLINLMLTFPNLSEYVYLIFLNNTFVFDSKTEQTVNDVLKHCIKNQYELEIVWLLTVMCCIKMKINKENIIGVLANSENCSTIIILDYIFQNNLNGEPNIKEGIDDLKTLLKNEKIYGEKWLLLYEVNRNRWIKGLKNNLNESPFLKDACSANIPFYWSPII